MVNIPSFVVRLDSQKHIDFSLRSPYGGGRPGKFILLNKIEHQFKKNKRREKWSLHMEMIALCVIVEVFVSLNLETYNQIQ